MFKPGDKVRFKRRGEQPTGKDGDTFTVKCVSNSGKSAYLFDRAESIGGADCDCGDRHQWVEEENDIEVISSGSVINTMTLKDKVALAFKGEPEKSFIKAGIMDINGNLTSEGREVWTQWLVKKWGADFKKEVVDPILAEDAASKE